MGHTLGIDLSSQPRNTGLCLIEWSRGQAEVTALWRGRDPHGHPLDDGLLMAAMEGAHSDLAVPSKVAIDAPLGWPVDFVRSISDLNDWPVKISESRERLERRATDHWVHRKAEKQPLSVSTDRIAYPAMRAAGLLAHYVRSTGEAVDRSGVSGLVCETYPDPAIRKFDLWPAGAAKRASYKRGAREVREGILVRLDDSASWLALSDEDRQACIDFDDCLDALICALVARAAERTKTIDPPDALVDEAAVEGWIHLPQPGCLSELCD